MGLTDILKLILACFQFPETVLKFVNLLKKTPEAQHEDLLKRLGDEQKKFEDTGRPPAWF